LPISPLPAFVSGAIDLVKGGAPWVIAYDVNLYYNLSMWATERYLRLSPAVQISIPKIGEYDHKITSWAGMLVMTREAFVEVGGYDERFMGWGYEDNAFAEAADCILGKHRRVLNGYAVHLYHPVPVDGAFAQPNIEYNRRLYSRYSKAKNKLGRMREIV